MARDAAFHARDEQVLEPNIGKSAARHHVIVAAPRAIGVEVARCHAALDQIFSCRAVGGDVARRGDVIGGDGIAQQSQNARPVDILDVRHFHGQFLEEGRMLDVGRGFIPLIEITLSHLDLVPKIASGKYIRVFLAKHFRVEARSQRIEDFLRRRPDFFQVDRLVVFTFADGFSIQVNVHRPGQGIGHDQRRRCQVIGFDQGMNAPLEVAVARNDRRGDEVPAADGFRHLARQRAAVADAGGAAVADHVEAQFGERFEQVRLLEIFRDHARAGRQAGLDVWLDRQPFFDGLPGDQSRGDHHGWVAGIGAGGDGSDDYHAVADLVGAAVRADSSLFCHILGLEFVAAFLDRRGQRLLENLLHLGQGNAILRTLGAGQGGQNRPQVQFERVAKFRGGGARLAEQALGAAIGLDQFDLFISPARQAQIAQRLGIHREVADGGAVFGGHVGDGGAVRQRHSVQAGAVELDELVHHALLAQHLGDGQDQVGGRDAVLKFAVQLEPDHVRQEHVHWLAEHHGFGLDAAHAPAQHAQAVDHGGV